MKDRKIVEVMDHFFDLRNALMESLITEEAQRHFQSSKREAMCGLRDLIQHAIDKLEGQPSKNSRKEQNSNRTIPIDE